MDGKSRRQPCPGWKIIAAMAIEKATSSDE